MAEYLQEHYVPPVYYGDPVYDQWLSYWDGVAEKNLSQYDFRKFWHDRWLFGERITGGVLNADDTNKILYDEYHYPKWASEKSIMIENNKSWVRL